MIGTSKVLGDPPSVFSLKCDLDQPANKGLPGGRVEPTSLDLSATVGHTWKLGVLPLAGKVLPQSRQRP